VAPREIQIEADAAARGLSHGKAGDWINRRGRDAAWGNRLARLLPKGGENEPDPQQS
jgi:hypothetical protein